MSKNYDLSEDEIIRDWTIDTASKNLIDRINKNHRIWFAIQLFAMKRYGRFLENPNELSSQVISYISVQLGVTFTFKIEKPARKATYIDHRKLIFEFLNFRNFDDNSIKLLHSWTTDTLNKGITLLDHLYPQAEQFLITNQIALPSTNQLKRFLRSLCSQYHNTLFEQVYASLPKNLILYIDQLLLVEEVDSWFNQLKEYPEASSISTLKRFIAKYEKLNEVDLNYETLNALNPDFTNYLYQLGKYYSADKIKRLKFDKRYTLMAVFLRESKKNIIDYIVQLHDQYISDICRECNNLNEEQIKQYRYKNAKAIDKFVTVIDHILCQDTALSIELAELYTNTVSEELLKEAREDVNSYQKIIKFGYSNLLQNRYNSMRRYFSDFIKIPFCAEAKDSLLLKSINLIKQLDNNIIKVLPNYTPKEFIDYKIKNSLIASNGDLKRNLWEIGVAIALRNNLRSGEIYIPESKKHVSFWNLVYSKENWEKTRDQIYEEFNILKNPKLAVNDLEKFFHETAKNTQEKFGKDGFAIIKKGELKLTKPDKLIIPENISMLQKKITSCLPKIKIEQLLIEVDQMTGFSRHFSPIHGQNSSPEKFYKTLMASILSQATNIGIATMQNCTTDITADMMRHVIDTYIREDTIKLANAEIVNQHSLFSLSMVHGLGHISSSDAQRFAVIASSLISSFYPRYFGYYEKAIGIYTHVSDQYSVYNTKVISCSPREALYVIDGLLENNTVLEIKEHTTDTAGYTEHVFALCYLLGYKFMPRIRDLKDQQLYKIDKNISYGDLDILLDKTIDLNLIEEQWDQMIRVVGSLKNKLAPANEIIKRIGKGSPSDRLSKAFTHLGRLIKTEYILRYLTTPELRHKVQRQLNKGEHRHALSRWIFFANHGKFQVGDYEEIMNKSSCLSLVSNAVLYWNTVKMEQIIKMLEKEGEKIDEDSLSHVSLLSHKHVIPMGTYFVEPEYEQTYT